MRPGMASVPFGTANERRKIACAIVALSLIERSQCEAPSAPRSASGAKAVVIRRSEACSACKRFARYWLRTPQPDLGDRTALDWLTKGKLEEIRDHVSRVVNLQPD
jgi:hypothetical protein